MRPDGRITQFEDAVTGDDERGVDELYAGHRQVSRVANTAPPGIGA